MGKHETGYARVPRDLYPTPPWVTETLVELVNIAGKDILESACGDGRMSDVLIRAGARVYSTDIVDHGYAGLDELLDFTASTRLPRYFDGLITNPPFGSRGKLAQLFVETGLRHIRSEQLGFLALLLPVEFDSAKSRLRLFGACPEFVGKIVLTRRVKWFEHPTKPNRQPKENSAWFLWGDIDLRMPQSPVIRYAPIGKEMSVQWSFV
jgi:predicted RNA methylase